MVVIELLFLAAAGLLAGFINGVAGGGSLVSFPALLAVGVPALSANVTSTIGIWPGYLGGVAGFRGELVGDEQRARLRRLAPATAAGAVSGVVLLLTTPAEAFAAAVPWLILFACALFAVQPLLVKRLRSQEVGHSRRVPLQVGVFLGSAYGAYFGAGLGVVLLAVLGLTVADKLPRLNGLRSVISLAVNTIAALLFVATAPVVWAAAATMAISSFGGGYLGARVARRLSPNVLRAAVVVLGVIVSLRLLLG